MGTQKSAVEKLKLGEPGKVIVLPPEKASKFGGELLVIPSPWQVMELIKSIPKGKIVLTSDLRETLAKTYGGDSTCPLCTGIFWKIAADAAKEDESCFNPYWRVVKPDGALNTKIPEQRQHLEQEGIEFVGNKVDLSKAPRHSF